MFFAFLLLFQNIFNLFVQVSGNRAPGLLKRVDTCIRVSLFILDLRNICIHVSVGMVLQLVEKYDRIFHPRLIVIKSFKLENVMLHRIVICLRSLKVFCFSFNNIAHGSLYHTPTVFAVSNFLLCFVFMNRYFDTHGHLIHNQLLGK